MFKADKKYFPWRNNNSIEVLKNGMEFYIAMIDSINKATEYILFETYFVESGNITTRFIDALLQACQRNVKVYFILDSMGSRSLATKDVKRLQNSEIHICFYNPVKLLKIMNNFYRDHRKILLVDSRLVFIGGAGLSDAFVGGNYWRDNMFFIQGEIVKDWYQLFLQNWQKNSKQILPSFQAEALPKPSDNVLAKVVYTRGHLFNFIKKSILEQVNKSQTEIWLATAYFIPSRALRRSLIAACKRGVKVCILVPGIETDNAMVRNISRGYYFRLLKYGVQIYEYQNHFIHSKVLLIDEWVSIGSSNMDRWGAKWNLEANQEIKDKKFAETIYNMMKDDLNNCQQITFQYWSSRPFIEKMRTYFWKYFGKLLSFISLRKN